MYSFYSSVTSRARRREDGGRRSVVRESDEDEGEDSTTKVPNKRPHPLRHSESLDEGQDAPESPELSVSGLGGDRFMAEERRRSSSYEDEIAKNWEYQCRNVLLDPDGQPYYYWLAVVALATMYNCGIIILRLAFSELRDGTCYQSWFSALDYLSDVIYFVDIGVHMRTGYLEDGILVLDPEKLKQNYMGRQNFKLAVLSLLPFGSFLGLLSGLASIFGLRFADKNLVHSPLLRIHRLLKYHMIPKFFEITDSRTSNPNVVRAFKLSLYLWVVIHWIGCFYYIVSEYEGFGTTGWVYPSDVDSQRFFRKYTLCIYWSMMTLTTIGERPPPETDIEYIFTGITFLIGVFVFAAVVGNVGDVISNMNAARQDYLARMDQIKFYMNHRNVPAFLQNRVKRWADYSWTRTQAIDEASLLDMLPERIRTEIAIHTNLDTLKKVQIFEECEEGLLQELVLKLRPQIYSPRDYICRIGEIGREMYIINHGRVEILVKNPSTGGKMVVATLTAGNYFGEISLLKLDAGQNRRTADVRSVGYSELLCLSRKDLICALAEYPDAKVILEEKARERMQMNKQARRSSSQGLSGQEDTDQQTTNQNLSCDQAINKKSRLADVIRSNLFQNMVAKRGQEMTELKKVIEELKAFDSQATKIRVQRLSNKCEQLMAQLRSRDSELQQAIKRIAELEQVILGPAKRKWKALERQDKNNTHGQSDETDMETNGNGSPVGDNIDISQSVTASSKPYENGLGNSWTNRENVITCRVNRQADHFRSDGPVYVDTSDTRTDCRKDSVVHRTPNSLPVTNNNPSITDNRKSPCQNDRDLISDDNPDVEPALDLDTALLAVLSLGESEQLSDFSDSNSSSDADSDDIDL